MAQVVSRQWPLTRTGVRFSKQFASLIISNTPFAIAERGVFLYDDKMMNQSIVINTVSKAFGKGSKKQQVLHNLSLTVEEGEVFGFLGPNGAGKSTTIKMLLNFIRPDSGTLRINGHTVGRQEYRQQIGYLSEFPCFYEHLTPVETLRFAGRLSGMDQQTLSERIEYLLDRMNLTGAANKRVSAFSKGMKQRLGMANALVHDPAILIFDEPMSGLDPVGRHLIKGIIAELREQGKTIFFSSHILSDIEELCDRIGILHKGHLLHEGELAGFLADDGTLEDKFVAIIEEWNRANAL